MSDPLSRLLEHPLGLRLARTLGLPTPVALPRQGPYEARPFAGKQVLLGGANGYAEPALARALTQAGAVLSEAPTGALELVVFDATGLATPRSAQALYDFFHPLPRRLAPGAKVLVIAADPGQRADASSAAVARGVQGFVRSLAKEIGKRGATANVVTVAPDACERLAGLLSFFGTAHSAYVSGQVLHVDAAVQAPPAQPATQVLAGKTALVTGAARGIGRATAERLALEGATVICLDVPQAQTALAETALAVGGKPLALDIAAPDAAQRLAEFLGELGLALDVVVHNAGITRDKTLANMQPAQWAQVVSINLEAAIALDTLLIHERLLKPHGRIVCLSSVAGLAGNFGQTNYAFTKAALAGYVAALAPRLAPLGGTSNAIAPGFIETPMTAQIPFATREIGRRLNALSQGGLPADVAEAIAFLASPGAYGVTGQVLRVCGQALIGA